jgi:hypothetical protein
MDAHEMVHFWSLQVNGIWRDESEPAALLIFGIGTIERIA